MKPILTVTLLTLLSCSQVDNTTEPPASEPKIIAFGTRELQKYDEQDPGGYAYDITVFDMTNAQQVEGYFHFYPYGSDSSVGSFEGTYDSTSQVFQGKISAYAEGEMFEDFGVWKIQDGQLISGYFENIDQKTSIDISQVDWNEEYPTPAISYETSKTWLEELNTTWASYSNIDLSRLEEAIEIKVNPAEVKAQYGDLDSNYETEETFFYLLGTKELIVLDKNNEVTFRFNDVQLPVFMESYTEDNVWRGLAFDTKEGFKKLSYGNGNYDQATIVNPREITWHPENYYQVF